MMGNVQQVILCQNIMELQMLSRLSTKMKELKVCIKAFIFRFYVKQAQWDFSFGSNSKLN
jgi:hypothetical protein